MAAAFHHCHHSSRRLRLYLCGILASLVVPLSLSQNNNTVTVASHVRSDRRRRRRSLLTTTTTTANTAPTFYCGGCCSTADAWNTVTDRHEHTAIPITCGDRITYLQHERLYTEQDACHQVGHVEFPDACGACSCHSTTRTRTDDNTMVHVVVQQPGGFVPIRPEESVQAQQQQPPPCGCHSCTAVVLDRTAMDADGVVATCRDRIAFLQQQQSEHEACHIVAHDEFPDLCGPACDPQLCDIVSTTTGSKVTGGTTNNNAVSSSTGPLRGVFVPPQTTIDDRSSVLFLGVDTTLTGATMPTSIHNNNLQQQQTNTKQHPFGPHVLLFDPSMSTAAIQDTFDRIFREQAENEMGQERYGLYFLPGVYGTPTDPLQLQMGYSTEVAGLGAVPTDVVIHGKIEVYNRCFAKDPYVQDGKFIPSNSNNEGELCFALNNFWRSLSNISIQVAHKGGGATDSCRSTAMFWAISQASSMRRVDIRGSDVALMDYCSNPGFASGGFIADSKISGTVINGGQQQFLSRNMEIHGWEGAVWNSFFLGVAGAPDGSSFPDPPFTSFPQNPLSREKPFLFQRNGQYFIERPLARTSTSGTSWGSVGPTNSIPLSDFFVTNPSHSIDTINHALQAGKHLLLTPGVYFADRPIVVSRSGTVVLGLGHATIQATTGAIAMHLADQPGIIVAGVTFDAGPVESRVLLQVGEDRFSNSNGRFNSGDPVTLHDVYFRVGGPYIGKATVCLEINSNHVLIDHTWVWRADHGVEPFNLNNGFEGDNERWRDNIGLYGVVVNGDDVTATGLFVEHYQKHNVLWNGEGGRVFFFQNELPYDPPNQAAWNVDSPTLGWSGYKVSNWVQNHELWGGGVYCYNRNDPSVRTENGFEAPTGNPGVRLRRLYTRNLSGPGTINHILNGMGLPVTEASKGPEYLMV